MCALSHITYSQRCLQKLRQCWVWFSTRPFKLNFRLWCPACVRLSLSLSLPLKLSKSKAKVQTPSKIAEACRHLRLSWRCRPFEDSCWCVVGRHPRQWHVAWWSCNAPWCALSEHWVLDLELDGCCWNCHSRSRLGHWWRREGLSKSSY